MACDPSDWFTDDDMSCVPNEVADVVNVDGGSDA